MRALVSVEWLAEHRDDALVVVDASMAPPGSGDPLPVDGIPGAVRFDIEAAVLDGGLPAWTEAGHPLAPVAASLDRLGDVSVVWDASAFVDADATAAALATGGAAVLDARSPSRFTGAEPDPREGVRAGHMPGARSLHYAAVAPQGRMLPADELGQRLRDAAGQLPIVASCGSGVTAAVPALAATLVGREASVYDGSWSEWGRDGSGRPVTTGA